MSLDDRLARWVAKGFITAEQANQIRQSERGDERPLFLFAVAGLGGLAIAIGLVSIVAANWDAIPGSAKLGIDLALVAGLGYAVARWHRRGQLWAREVGIVVLYGLILASIALIGQVYQLGGEAHQAMGLWTLLTALLMTRGTSGWVAAVWLIGLQTTYVAWVAWAAEAPLRMSAYVEGALCWAVLTTIAVGRSAWVRGRRPALAGVFEAAGWAELVLFATVGTFAFYNHRSAEEPVPLLLGLAVSALVAGLLWIRLPATPRGQMGRWLLFTCVLFGHVPALISSEPMPVLAALSFIGLWLVVAFAAHRTARVAILNAATAIIGIRILAAYFEVFGTLLDTGLGLVSGGALTLGLVWLWVRKRRDFERELGTPTAGRP